jgi:hypothetical protein
MGNRAVITTLGTNPKRIGLYLHWHGGRDSVEAFLKYAELRQIRKPECDDGYFFARFAQIVSNFFGNETLSVGINTLDRLDCNNGDNGVYYIQGYEIVGREFAPQEEQQEYDLYEMLKLINHSQPKEAQISDELLLSPSYKQCLDLLSLVNCTYELDSLAKFITEKSKKIKEEEEW